MKKLALVLIVCAMLISMAACSGALRFDSEDTLLQHLNGMWVEDKYYGEKNYFVFQDGKIYAFNEAQFSNEVEECFDSVADTGNLTILSRLDFNTTMLRMGTDWIQKYERENATIQPKKGKIIFDAGKSYETSIFITDEGVFFDNGYSEDGQLLTKISDKPDFSGENFTERFNRVKKEYSIPISAAICDAEAYGRALKSIHPEVKEWILVEKSETTTMYTTNGSVTKNDGAFVVADNMVLLTKGRSADGSAPFLITYHLGDRYQLIISDRYGFSLRDLLRNAEPLLKNIPGALSTTEIINRFEQQHKVSNGARTLNTTEASVTYLVTQATTGNTTVIQINFPDEIHLSDAEN